MKVGDERSRSRAEKRDQSRKKASVGDWTKIVVWLLLDMNKDVNIEIWCWIGVGWIVDSLTAWRPSAWPKVQEHLHYKERPFHYLHHLSSSFPILVIHVHCWRHHVRDRDHRNGFRHLVIRLFDLRMLKLEGRSWIGLGRLWRRWRMKLTMMLGLWVSDGFGKVRDLSLNGWEWG